MVYRAPLYITPTSLTNLTVFVESDIGNGIHKILTLDDFTLDNDKLKYNGVGYSVEATYKIYSSGYAPETVSVSSADTGTGVEVALTSVSNYSKTSDGTNTYYVKDAYARDMCSDIVDTQNVIADTQITLANNTLSNVSSIDSNSAVKTALDTKLNTADVWYDSTTSTLNIGVAQV